MVTQQNKSSPKEIQKQVWTQKQQQNMNKHTKLDLLKYKTIMITHCLHVAGINFRMSVCLQKKKFSRSNIIYLVFVLNSNQKWFGNHCILFPVLLTTWSMEKMIDKVIDNGNNHTVQAYKRLKWQHIVCFICVAQGCSPGVPNLFWPKIYFSSSQPAEIYQSSVNIANSHIVSSLQYIISQHFFLLSHNH